MKKFIIRSIVILFILIVIFDVYFIFLPQKTNCFKEKFSQKIADEDFYKDNISNLYLNEFVSIKNCTLDLKGKPYILSEKLTSDPVLVLRCSMFNCSVCINFVLDKLKTHFKDYATNNRILLIYDDENMRVSETMFGKLPYVTKDRHVLGLPLEDANLPFFFILNNDMKTKLFFIPEKGMPILTDEYLSIIKKRYFKNNLTMNVRKELKTKR